MELFSVVFNTILQPQDMDITIQKGYNIDYFMLRAGMLAFQVIEGYSCIDNVVLIGDIKKSKRCKWLH